MSVENHCNRAIELVEKLNKLDVHKQHANRYLEPFEYITVIVTASEWDGFWEQRCPKYHTPVSGEGYYFKSKKDCIANHSNEVNLAKLETFTQEEWHSINTNTAQPEMMELAEMMWDAYNESKPKQLYSGEWHMPFNDMFDTERMERMANSEYDQVTYGNDEIDPPYGYFIHDYVEKIKLKVSVARCARVSYLNHEGKDDYEADIKLYDFLKEQYHMSPFEHVAKAMDNFEYFSHVKGYLDNKDVPCWEDIRDDNLDMAYHSRKKGIFGWCDNIRGFIQHRWEIENEA